MRSKGAKGKFLSANIGNKEHHQTCLCISQFQVLPSLPWLTPGQFFRQIPGGGGAGFPGTLNFNKLYTTSPIPSLNHYLPIVYLQIRIENTDLSMRTM